MVAELKALWKDSRMLAGIIVPALGIYGITGENSSFPFKYCSESWKKDIQELGLWHLKKFASDPFYFEYYTPVSNEENPPVFVFEKCSSVMDLISQLKKQGLIGDWGSVISIIQTKGRGRFGRKWESVQGNLHAAIQLPDIQDDFSDLLAMMVSVILVEYLKSSGIEARLKWPNDIIFEDKKIAGILVEKKQSGYTVGIGVNLETNPPVSDMREGFVFPAGTVSFPENYGGPLKLWIAIVRLLIKRIYEIIYSMKLQRFISLADEMLLWKGSMVRISDIPEGEITGEICGIGKTGGLIITESGREKEIFSGTVVRLNNQ